MLIHVMPEFVKQGLSECISLSDLVIRLLLSNRISDNIPCILALIPSGGGSKSLLALAGLFNGSFAVAMEHLWPQRSFVCSTQNTWNKRWNLQDAQVQRSAPLPVLNTSLLCWWLHMFLNILTVVEWRNTNLKIDSTSNVFTTEIQGSTLGS